jgi:flagellar hook assembly protein FlgD
MDVQIQVYTVSGRLVKTILEKIPTLGFRMDGISWDGKDDFGDKLARGVYVYSVTIKTDSGETAQKTEKLVIF